MKFPKVPKGDNQTMNVYVCKKCGTRASKDPCGTQARGNKTYRGLGHWTCPKCGTGIPVQRKQRKADPGPQPGQPVPAEVAPCLG